MPQDAGGTLPITARGSRENERAWEATLLLQPFLLRLFRSLTA